MTTRSKRADLHISLSTLIDIVLVTIALLVLFGIYKAVTGIFTENPDKETASRNNYHNLITAFNEMKDGEKREMPLYISDKWFIVAFNKDATILPAQCGTSKTVQKPVNCIGNCLCLCTISEACLSKTECRTIEGEYTFKDPCYKGQKEPQIAYLSKTSGTLSLSLTKQ
jgi:hypothetical protein